MTKIPDSRMAMYALAASLAWLVGFVSSSPTTTPGVNDNNNSTKSECASFPSDSFTVNQYQLYPENAKSDPQRCVVYLGALFNASVAVFDPATKSISRVIVFPPLTGDPTLHLGPALPDLQGGLTVLFDAAAAFNTFGQDVSGSNVVVKYDLTTNQIRWQRNLTEFTEGAYGGYQDVEHDKNGNIYVVGTFPGTVLRVTPDGTSVTPWFLPAPEVLANTTVAGFGGLASIRERDLLLTNNNADGQIYRFDGVSAAANGTPVLIPRTAPNSTEAPAPLEFSDAILLPAKYKNTILLVAEDAIGVTVLRSRDGSWQRAETLGRVLNDAPESEGGQVVATVEIGGAEGSRIFAVQEFFTDPVVPGTLAGNRSSFPMIDITAEVDELVTRSP